MTKARGKRDRRAGKAELGRALAELKRAAVALPDVESKTQAQSLVLPALPPGKTREQDIADVVSAGIAGNAIATRQWAYVQPNLTELYRSLDAMGERVRGGDLGALEKLLAAQVATMGAAFVAMMQRAQSAKTLEPMEIYTRLGLRMQNQCRATAETLATMKMPPVFAKNYQANIANGPQQVNNGGAPARAEIGESAQTKLLEAVIEAERVDTGTEGTAAGRDSVLATVDAVNRAAHGKRKGARCAKRVQGRRTGAGARGCA